jgi:hypothetical protein
LSVYLNYAVWDIEKGVILKIVEGKRITHAIRGYKKLEMKEIKELYGENAIFEPLNSKENTSPFAILSG